MDESRTNPIRAARLRRRLSQQGLAAKVKVSKAAVSAWECGKAEPAPRTALALVKVLPTLRFEQIYPVEPPSDDEQGGAHTERAAA